MCGLNLIRSSHSLLALHLLAHYFDPSVWSFPLSFHRLCSHVLDYVIFSVCSHFLFFSFLLNSINVFWTCLFTYSISPQKPHLFSFATTLTETLHTFAVCPSIEWTTFLSDFLLLSIPDAYMHVFLTFRQFFLFFCQRFRVLWECPRSVRSQVSEQYACVCAWICVENCKIYSVVQENHCLSLDIASCQVLSYLVYLVTSIYRQSSLLPVFLRSSLFKVCFVLLRWM